jgi:hypothetical protein
MIGLFYFAFHVIKNDQNEWAFRQSCYKNNDLDKSRLPVKTEIKDREVADEMRRKP